MKKFFFFLLSAATLIFAASCTKEQVSSISAGNEVAVTFTANLGSLESRGISDGQKVNEVAWAIYLAGSNEPLPEFYGVLPINNKEGKLEVRLATGKSYDLAFFAYYKDGATTEQALGAATPKYYTVDWNTKSVTINDFTVQNANDSDNRDCFWHVEKNFKVEAPVNKTFKLTRPLAQLNFGATIEDTKAAADAGLVVGQSKIVASTYPSFNMFDGKCGGQLTEVTFAQNAIPQQVLEVKDVNYTYLGTAYVLVNDEMTQDVSMTIYNEGGEEINTIKYSYAPFQRNWRTNILGALLTNPVDLTIIIEDRFVEPGYLVKHWDGTTKAVTADANGVYNITEAAEAAWIAAQVNSGENSFEGAEVVIPEGTVIDLNGLNGVVWTPIGNATYPFKGTFNGNGAIIRNMVVNTPEYAGLFGNVLSTSISNINIEDATINASHYAGAVVGYAYSNITNCSVKGLTINVVPNEVVTREAAYDNGDKVGGIAGYVGENTGNGYVVSNNSVEDAVITAYRDLGGIAGAAYLSECKGNVVKKSKLTVDQTVNNYGTEDANLDKIVGRVLGGEVNEEENTAIDVELVWNPYSLRPCIENVIAAGQKASTTAKGWVLATNSESMILADETGWIFCFRPKGYADGLPAVGSVISLTGRTSLYPTSGNVRMLQFDKLAVITDLGKSVEVVHPEPEVFDAAKIDSWVDAPVRTYITMKGVLNIVKSGSSTYYNIAVDGTDNIGAILTPMPEHLEHINSLGLDGKPIEVKGYTAYTNSSGGKKIVQMVITDLKDFYELTPWSIVGDMTGWGNNPDIPMYTYGDGLAFAKNVEIAEGQGFKVRIISETGGWDDNNNYGTNDVKIYSNMPIPVYTSGGSGNIIPIEAGTYDIYFDTVNKDKVYVMEAGKNIKDALPYEKYEEPIYHTKTWRIVGAFNGWDPADDNYKMTLTEDNKWATIVAEFATDTELKFVSEGVWNDANFGNGVTVELNTEYPATQDGANINVPAGKYYIKLSMCDGRFVFQKPIVNANLSFSDTANRVSLTSTQQVWSQNGITMTNDKAKSTTNVADYSNPVRLYAKSKVTVSVDGSKINEIVFNCNTASYASSLNKSITGAQTSVSGSKVTVVPTEASNSFVIESLTAQVRVDSIDVNYEM